MADAHRPAKDQRKDSAHERNNAPSSSGRARSPTVTSFRRDSRPSFVQSSSPSRKRPFDRSLEDRARGRKIPRQSPPPRENDLYRPDPDTGGVRRPSPPGGPARKRRPSPRRQSPDHYTPPAFRNRRFRPPPGASTYRPGEDSQRRRSRTPPRQARAPREPSPRRRRRSPSPYRNRPPSPRRGRRLVANLTRPLTSHTDMPR